ncbi:MAG: conjugal transfer protein TraX, partial [Oscillospiraceae bacterium]|nr:conjugal transfer protein TraX [Oscillospiraceae bacterium]
GYFTEWSFWGVLFILLLYIFRERPWIRFAVYESLMLVYVLYMSGFSIFGFHWLLFMVFSLPIIIITLFYNGKKGHFPKLSKYFFYFFYPAHLLLIYIVKILYKA